MNRRNENPSRNNALDFRWTGLMKEFWPTA
jgi:hypothetical protein